MDDAVLPCVRVKRFDAPVSARFKFVPDTDAAEPMSRSIVLLLPILLIVLVTEELMILPCNELLLPSCVKFSNWLLPVKVNGDVSVPIEFPAPFCVNVIVLESPI